MSSPDSGGVPPIRVLLVDDHPAVRQGLALLLELSGITVCGEAQSAAEALAIIAENRPDMAILDLSLDGGEDGLALAGRLRRFDVPLLIYSMHRDTRRVAAAFQAGALGYVTKRESQETLVTAVREVAARRRFVSPEAAAALAEWLSGSGVDSLSARERKVYDRLAKGAGTLGIAASLGISTNTVESYYTRILSKLGLDGMQELRRHAIEYYQNHAL